jgi:hypothetical protein
MSEPGRRWPEIAELGRSVGAILPPTGPARPLLQPALVPSGRATLALAPTGAVLRVLSAAAALSAIVVGCSSAIERPPEGRGGGSASNHGGDGGSGGELSVIAGITPGPAGGAGGHGGSGGASGSATTAESATSSSASSATSSTSSAGTGGLDPGACDPDEIADTAPIAPDRLSATGLYRDLATKELAADVLPFAPQFPLWSDGAEKHRWVHLPGCAKIDTSNMDEWQVPVGTKIWKEFVFDGARVETRYLHRWGPESSDFIFQAYQWDAEGTDATAVPRDGIKDANGTLHDIPGEWECEVCHGKAPERVLGLGAIQLSHAGPGLTIESLSAAGRLTVPSAGYSVPGDDVARAALGYLHGNCAHCHNPSPKAEWFTRPFSLKLLTTATTVAETDAVVTAVGVAPEKFVHPGIAMRIAAGDPASSAVAYRISVRGSPDAMPALGSEIVDPAGVAAITAWIGAMAP